LDQVSGAVFEVSLDALAKAEVETALDVFRRAGELEDEFDAAMRHLMTFVFEDTTLVGQVIDIVFTLRALESIGDAAINIAEQVVFVAKGKDVRYQNKEILAEALSQRKRP
jgi:phosphate transport system protein